jgi:transcriptional regulator with XRE-family HTH domain
MSDGDKSRLRRQREAAGLTGREAADLVGIDESVWSEYETERRRVTPRVRVLISRRLGWRIRDIFEPEAVPVLETVPGEAVKAAAE